MLKVSVYGSGLGFMAQCIDVVATASVVNLRRESAYNACFALGNSERIKTLNTSRISVPSTNQRCQNRPTPTTHYLHHLQYLHHLHRLLSSHKLDITRNSRPPTHSRGCSQTGISSVAPGPEYSAQYLRQNQDHLEKSAATLLSFGRKATWKQTPANYSFSSLQPGGATTPTARA